MTTKDAYYFPHFTNARNDRKIKRVRKVLQTEGYAIFFMILEVLREQEDYCYPLADIDLLADDFNTSTEKVEAVIHQFDLFEIRDGKFFFSAKLIEYLQPWIQKKQRLRIAGIKGNLKRHGHASKKELDVMTDAEIIALNKEITGFSSLGGRPAIAEQSQTSKENYLVKKSTNESEKLHPPSRSEVLDFFSTNDGEKRSAKNFFDHYQATGWMIGSSPLRNWQARAKKWIREDNAGAADSFSPDQNQIPRGASEHPESTRF